MPAQVFGGADAASALPPAALFTGSAAQDRLLEALAYVVFSAPVADDDAVIDDARHALLAAGVVGEVLYSVAARYRAGSPRSPRRGNDDATDNRARQGQCAMIEQFVRFAIRAPKLVLAVAGIAFVLFGLVGVQVTDRLSVGGFLDPDAESSQAERALARDFDISGMQLIFAVEAPGDVLTGAGADRANDIVDELRADDRVRSVDSPWTDPSSRARSIDRDGQVGLIVAGLTGDDNQAQETAADLAARHTGTTGEITVTAGGQAMAFQEINERAARDLALAESLAIPLTFLLLIWFLRSVVAAAIPVVVGVLAIVATTAVLFALTFVIELSVFALNITTALGLALAIDYSLLIIGRFREEIARGHDQHSAIALAMRRGGRAVLFSGVTVALALIGMSFFPMNFLRSIGYAGVAVVALSVVLALTCVPALLALLGERITRKPLREAVAVESTFLYRLAVAVQKHPVLIALPVLGILLIAGAPVLGMQVGLPDDRVLPDAAQSRQVGDTIREQFDANATGTVHIIYRDRADDAKAAAEYAAALSRVRDVDVVLAPSGTYAGGQPMGPGDPGAARNDSTHLTIATSLDPYSPAAARQLDELDAVEPPGDAVLGGLAQQKRDTAAGIGAAFPKALAWIAVTTFVLLLLLTGSLLLPLKALALNILSLMATFGALVWVFQSGHLGGFGTETTGFTVATVPVLLFCVAFGLSMDYEVFLLARFAEEWETSEHTRADNDRAVAVGLARSGQVVTAAAAIMIVIFAAIATSGVSIMRMLGVGLALAVLVDATLIRMILVPAFMRLAGTWNWWAPRGAQSILAKVRLRE
ncbi:MMPL family transporter [Nocardia fluminea]